MYQRKKLTGQLFYQCDARILKRVMEVFLSYETKVFLNFLNEQIDLLIVMYVVIIG